MIPMNHSESVLFTPYRSLVNQCHRLNARNAAVMNPVTVISGNPRNLYRAIAEFAYSGFFRYGRIIAAIDVPKNVTAITNVASRM